MSFKETNLGFEFRTAEFLVFFGKKESSLENLKQAYPQLNFKSLWQVHGNQLLHTNEDFENNSVKADAHWTDKKNLALVSKSADCIPVLAINKDRTKILAIHAGWRGVQNQIIPQSFQKLQDSWDIFIGPHITKASFEIQDDCFELLHQSTSLDSKKWFSNGKADLLKIVNEQLESISSIKNSVETLIFDTVLDQRFHSHRRDRELAGRQNSFVVLLG